MVGVGDGRSALGDSLGAAVTGAVRGGATVAGGVPAGGGRGRGRRKRVAGQSSQRKQHNWSECAPLEHAPMVTRDRAKHLPMTSRDAVRRLAMSSPLLPHDFGVIGAGAGEQRAGLILEGLIEEGDQIIGVNL